MSKLLSEDDILQYGLQFIKAIGENIVRTPRITYIFRLFNTTILLITLIFILNNYTEAKDESFIKTIEGAITIIHVSFSEGEYLYKLS